MAKSDSPPPGAETVETLRAKAHSGHWNMDDVLAMLAHEREQVARLERELADARMSRLVASERDLDAARAEAARYRDELVLCRDIVRYVSQESTSKDSLWSYVDQRRHMICEAIQTSTDALATPDATAAWLAALKADVREECAKVAETTIAELDTHGPGTSVGVCIECRRIVAANIRALNRRDGGGSDD